MPGITPQVRAEWNAFIDNQAPPAEASVDYFDFSKWKLPQAQQHAYVVPLPPTGFEIEEGSGYQSESSTVSLWWQGGGEILLGL